MRYDDVECIYVNLMLPSRDRETGKFCSSLPEGLDPKPISVKLTPSIKQRLKCLAGSDMSGWIREAIVEKLEREQEVIS